ncbi:MAG: tolB protein precursor, partial [Solirubrobacterales bacterium]|nr:tolB protein precursor [Solirubrobacterales bacterium]
MHRRSGVLSIVLAIACVGLAAPVAHADRIAFSCGTPAFQDVCASPPDGGPREVLLTGATGAGQDRYGSPSLSADGTKLAYTYKGQAYVKDLATNAVAGPELGPGNVLTIRMRPDGRFLALGQFSDGGVCVYAADLTGRHCVGRAGSYGFAANGDLLTDTTVAPDYRSAICRLPITPDDGLSGCHGIVLQDGTQNLADASTSPDGTRIAVTRSTAIGQYGRIAIFDATSGALLNEVSAGPDAFPAWSPDSRSVVFDRKDGGIWIAAANGAP